MELLFTLLCFILTSYQSNNKINKNLLNTTKNQKRFECIFVENIFENNKIDDAYNIYKLFRFIVDKSDSIDFFQNFSNKSNLSIGYVDYFVSKTVDIFYKNMDKKNIFTPKFCVFLKNFCSIYEKETYVKQLFEEFYTVKNVSDDYKKRLLEISANIIYIAIRNYNDINRLYFLAEMTWTCGFEALQSNWYSRDKKRVMRDLSSSLFSILIFTIKIDNISDFHAYVFYFEIGFLFHVIICDINFNSNSFYNFFESFFKIEKNDYESMQILFNKPIYKINIVLVEIFNIYSFIRISWSILAKNLEYHAIKIFLTNYIEKYAEICVLLFKNFKYLYEKIYTISEYNEKYQDLLFLTRNLSNNLEDNKLKDLFQSNLISFYAHDDISEFIFKPSPINFNVSIYRIN